MWTAAFSYEKICSDFKEKYEKSKLKSKDINSYTKELFINDLRDNGISGLGGADYPTFLKYSMDNIRCLRDSILDIQSCTRAEHIDVEKSDETEVTITGRNIEDSYVEDAIDAPVQEEAKVMKLVRKDKKNQ